MATRALIGIYTDRAVGEWRGTYHHWDGYPSGLGKALWDIYHNIYPDFLSTMMEYIIDAHPEGWSTLVGRDFKQRPVWRDSVEEIALQAAGVKHEDMPPLAYKYRGEPPAYVDHTSDSWQEWAYVFDVQSNTMVILERVGFNAVKYAVKATIPLNGMEPDWQSLD